ncbi:MAG: hypothetical protein HC827_08110 [Cyanobacteria bacterium RM1_2_2]|nr:hypothetical protein [Cyanobacteria bacterium RM1_2_2]
MVETFELFNLLAAIPHLSQNADDGRVTAPSLFWGTGAIRRMPSMFGY